MGCCNKVKTKNKTEQKQPECYFSSTEKQNQLEEILYSWLGTPFKHWRGVKQNGCDCIHFVVRVFEEIGYFKKPIKIPWYERDWHLHRSDDKLTDGILKHFRKIKKIDNFDFYNGDIVLFQFGRTTSHAAIYYQGSFFQSLVQGGIQKTCAYDENWVKRITKIYRILG